MYEINFSVAKGSDWAEAIEFFDNGTNQPLTISGNDFELGVQDRNDCQMFTLSSEAGTITFPQPHIVSWRVTPTQLAGLCAGTTYRVGCRFTDDQGNIEQLFTGNLAVLDGEFTT